MKIAHLNESTQETQSIAAHCIATADMASRFSIDALKDLIYNIGLYHDIGKYQQSFQGRIMNNDRKRVEHAVCGALDFPKNVHSPFSLMAQFCIAGHHTGLPDGGTRSDEIEDATLYGKMSHPERLEDYSDYQNELIPRSVNDSAIMGLFEDVKNDKDQLFERYAFLTRYCFSCLTDADSLDTAHFGTGREDVELQSDFRECLQKLNSRLEQFICQTELQKARSRVQGQVYRKTEIQSDIYLMNMPTGSGKTLCSMKFALERAVKSGRRRIIYVIPYNSIIDQTVSEFEKIFGESSQILRHQSSFCYDDNDFDEDYRNLLKNVTENWNAQIIVTTSVQFFESVYKNKRNRLRKLHNMANSIIVFDEVHMMPAEYLQPCLRAVSQITRLLNSESVFLTATMPDFKKLVRTYSLPGTVIHDLVEDQTDFANFKKGDYVNLGAISEEALLTDAQDQPSSLIVVNRRKTASRFYQAATGKKFHLSTYMSAFDRQRTIDHIKKELSDLYADYPDLSQIPEERRITVISTSLIEAGVDLDFHTVYRELSGLDSILQAGGRCNREGKRSQANIKIFELDSASQDVRVNITKRLFEEYWDISDVACIREYYSQLYSFYDEAIKRNSIAENCKRADNLPFATYARNFNMIDSNTVAIAVAGDEQSRAMIEQLRSTGYTNYRKLQKYTFTVYEQELEDLLRQGAVREYGGIFCLINPDYYSKETGVRFRAADYYI